VDPGQPSQSDVPALLEAKAHPLPNVLPTQQTPRPIVQAETGEPASGQSFWQVGVVERGVAPVFVEYLTRQGFRARMAPGQSANGLRVLVGPLTDQADTEKAKRTLDGLGFQSFLKRY
jgi:cell division septation protein DedD